MSSYNFPKEWLNCPPTDAEYCQGTYFRVAKHNPPVNEDFLSQAELGRARSANECMRVGLSLLRKKTDAEHLIQLLPQLGKVILQAELTECHGKSKHTSSRQSPSHTTWWPFESLDRKMLFTAIKG